MAQSASLSQIPKTKYVEVRSVPPTGSTPLYQNAAILRSKTETEIQIAKDSTTGITDINRLLQQVQTDVDQIASDFVEFDTCIETRVMEMMKSSKDHMEWLKNTTHSTGVIAQKAADHAAIFKSECQKLDRKCKSLSGFEQFLADIQGKLTQLEASADALMGVNEKDMK